jgi:polyisoprenyl-teichoic acid--peptidoglycan teichoic acid transferase
VQTVERMTGVPIDGYAITGFEGFVDLIGGVHGIDIDVPFPIRDRDAHASFREGPTHLGGKEALAFARARHAFRDGDFTRSLNHGRLLIAAAATLAEASRSNTGPFVRWALEASDAVNTDLSIEDLFELLVAVPMFDPSRVENEVASGRVAMIGSQSVVLLDGRATAMFRDLARDGVLNG